MQSSKKPTQTTPVDDYNPGDRILHKAFGEGDVIKATPMGNDILLEINFDKVGTKKVMARFSNIKKI